MAKKKKRRRLKKSAKLGLIVILSILLMFLIFVMLQSKPDTDNDGPVNTDNPVQDDEISYEMFVSEGLKVIDAGNYAGVYMEDGSDEVVSNVMMIILENTSESDLQYAEITMMGTDARAYEFTVSNLPAGSKAVLLELNRQSLPANEALTGSADHVVFFQKPMSLCDDRLLITGMDGALNIKNITEEAISGDIYVYYKYSSSDLYYGGITFRVKVEGGLEAGELRQVMTGHYSPDGSTITMVTCGEE